ncbi:MAG: hypothetical protein V4813_01675 [Gemmatimonadota bacterium]
MSAPDAVITAVFRTLYRATVDTRATVVVRSGGERQARAVSQWLERAHGSRRTVIASRTAGGDVVLRLPASLSWQAVAPPVHP